MATITRICASWHSPDVRHTLLSAEVVRNIIDLLEQEEQ